VNGIERGAEFLRIVHQAYFTPDRLVFISITAHRSASKVINCRAATR